MPGRVRVRVSLDQSDRGWHFSGSTRSLLFRFRDGDPAEVTFGGYLSADQDAEIAPGRTFEASLELLVDPVDSLVHPGERFVVWYARDVGHGEVLGGDDG